MLISVCIPCHGRTYHLKRALPSLIEAANFSPPVEIVILDYNSPDDLDDYMDYMLDDLHDGDCHSLIYKKYTGRDYYHMAHARNLSVLASCGEFVIISCADVIMNENYIKLNREAVEEGNVIVHNRFLNFIGVIGVMSEEFIDAGGFDEGFEFYGKEDKDLYLRLCRRGKKSTQLPMNVLRLVTKQKEPGWQEERFKYYRPGISPHQMIRKADKLYQENIENRVLVANKDGWGKW